MLGPGRYSQWHSRFVRYLDTKSNGEYLRKCIFEGPYMPTNVLIAAVEAAENILPVAAHEEVETIHNMTAENKLYFQAEKGKLFFLILTLPEVKSLALLAAASNHISDNYFMAPITLNQIECTHTCNFLPHDQVRLPTPKRKEIANTSYSLILSPILRKTVNPEHARRDKDMQEELGTPCKGEIWKHKSGVKEYGITKGEVDDVQTRLNQGVPLKLSMLIG
ncbi:hypothetical protein Tco_0153649 [Tanacetum coccineum]